MPTGPNFRNAASKLRGEALLADMVQQNVQQTNNAATWYEGPHLLSINQVMDASIINLGLIAAEERRLAEEYDRRALICDDHTAAMAQWRLDVIDWEARYRAYNNAADVGSGARPEWPGSKPVEPVRWPLWVEEDLS